jgi:hypothetical protein
MENERKKGSKDKKESSKKRRETTKAKGSKSKSSQSTQRLQDPDKVITSVATHKNKILQEVKAVLKSIDNNNPEVATALKTVSIYIGNTVRFPEDPKYFQVNTGGKGFIERVGVLSQAPNILTLSGFSLHSDGWLRMELPQTQEEFDVMFVNRAPQTHLCRENIVCSIMSEIESFLQNFNTPQYPQPSQSPQSLHIPQTQSQPQQEEATTDSAKERSSETSEQTTESVEQRVQAVGSNYNPVISFFLPCLVANT